MITEQVKKFISEYIKSVVELEVLLLLYNDTNKEWTAEDVNQELRLSSIGATQILAELCSLGLVTTKTTESLLYKYSAKTNELNNAVGDLAKMYKTHKYTIINLIYSKPNSPVQLFADAFKLKKEEDKKEED